MRLPVLDGRLSLAAELFPACAYGADIGADHGRLSCYLLAKGICERMCVADISAASLRKAEMLLEQHGLSQRCDIRVGDGLNVLSEPAEAIAILGMGGHTLCGILNRGKGFLRGAELILSAHTDLPMVRKTLMALDYCIEAEKIAHAVGRYYVIMRAGPGKETLDEKQLFLGPRLLEGIGPEYKGYFAWRKAIAEAKCTENGRKEAAWLEEEEKRVFESQGY